MNRIINIVLGIVTTGMLCSSVAADVVFGSNFYWGNSPNSQVNELPGDGVAGVVPVDGWRDISENTLISGSSIFEDQFNQISATMAITGLAEDLDVKDNTVAIPVGDNEQLMHRGLRSGNEGDTLTFTISNLGRMVASGSFDLIAYFVNTENNKYDGTYEVDVVGDSGEERFGIVDDSFADPLDSGTGFDNSGQSTVFGTAGLVNYLRIENLAGRETLEFTVQNITGERVIVQGIQVISSVPEPSTLTLVLYISCVVLLFRKRQTLAPLEKVS